MTSLWKFKTVHLGININVQTLDKGWIPLDYAALNGHNKIVNILILNGDKINAKTNQGYTSLHLATFNGTENVIKALLNGGDLQCY